MSTLQAFVAGILFALVFDSLVRFCLRAIRRQLKDEAVKIVRRHGLEPAVYAPTRADDPELLTAAIGVLSLDDSRMVLVERGNVLRGRLCMEGSADGQ